MTTTKLTPKELFERFVEVKFQLDQLKELKKQLTLQLLETKITSSIVWDYTVTYRPRKKYSLKIDEEEAKKLYPEEYSQSQKLDKTAFAQLIDLDKKVIKTNVSPIYYVEKKK